MPDGRTLCVGQLQAEDVFQAYHKEWLVHNFADATDDAGHVTIAAQRIVPYGKRLSGGAQNDLVVRATAGHANAVD